LNRILRIADFGFLILDFGFWILDLFEQLPEILKHDVFFVRARAIGDKELLA
jgi:hypothetical protein